jgi:ABC-type glycerol-3-phosphate transport system substrate-binding protein
MISKHTINSQDYSATPVKFSWWYKYGSDEENAYWQHIADAYMELHPHVTIEIIT